MQRPPTRILAAAVAAAGLVLTGLIPTAAAAADPVAVSTVDFEDGTTGAWTRSGGTADTLSVVDDAAGKVLRVADRGSDYVGLQSPTGLFAPGESYAFSMRVKLAAGTPGTQARFVMKPAYTWIGNGPVSADAWTTLTGEWTAPADADPAGLQVYLGTGDLDPVAPYTYFVDDISIVRTSGTTAPGTVQDITPVKDTVDFPFGAAIDSRELTGPASELLLRHFDQVTSENYFKPEAWYDANRAFRPHAEAVQLMDFASEHGIRVYGHTLVWHGQTPDWFFQDETGRELTNSAADQEILRAHLHDHIFDVAKWLSDEYGAFGGGQNPLVSFDVVNEVVSDAADTPGGLRDSRWTQILGEDFLDLAFGYADEAFNHQYAAAGANRPIALFINDYNTEQGGKQARLHDLVARMLARGVPVDGVGHQFHVSLSMPVGALAAAIDAFADLPVRQAVTELDVTTGTPVTQANLIEQGYYYRDAFRVFRERADRLFSVTVWGLTDGRSWRADSGAPLLFDDGLQAKPAYTGVVDGDLPAPARSADVFRGDVPIDAAATTSPEWARLPLHRIDDASAFQLRWESDHLTAYARVDDASVEEADRVVFVTGGTEVVVPRGGADGAVVTERAGGYDVVARIPLAAPVEAGGSLGLDVRVTDGADTTAWNAPGATGSLRLLEPLSYAEAQEAATAPVVDGAIDAVWADAARVATGKQVQGTAGASADVRLSWKGDTLYVLAEVTDPIVDTTGSDPWIQDSVELYLDLGNVKNGAYRDGDAQIRISADNVVSFGTGDEAAQRARVQSATARTAGGYVVEAAISLAGTGGPGTFHGFDAQVNDAAAGARTGIRNWADPSGAGYQSTSRWGVLQLVAAPTEPEQPCAGNNGNGKGHGPCNGNGIGTPNHGVGNGKGKGNGPLRPESALLNALRG